MKISYVANDYSSYRLGNYYEDWVEFFSYKHEVNRLYPNSFSVKDLSDLKKSDLIVLGHSLYDQYKNYVNPLRSYQCYFLCKFIKSLSSNIPVILFTKNDYKVDHFEKKFNFSKFFGSKLIVTHTLYSVPFFKKYLNTVCVPFYANPKRFSDLEADRKIDIGFRGTLHDKWNFGRRSALVRKFQSYNNLNMDIVTSEKDGVNFLHGSEYNIWLNKCTLNINTVSALGTVGPKYYEQFLSGVVPLCPYDWYEGKLTPYVNYVPSNNLSEYDIKKVLQDIPLLDKIKTQNKQLCNEEVINTSIENIFMEIR